MATGPEHYQAAERLIAQANAITDGFPSAAYDQALREAQVHATLAVAYGHSRATFELAGLLRAMLDEIREARAAQ